jgi:hypothetical protein
MDGQTDIQTDRQTDTSKLIVAFRNFTKAPKKDSNLKYDVNADITYILLGRLNPANHINKICTAVVSNGRYLVLPSFFHLVERRCYFMGSTRVHYAD